MDPEKIKEKFGGAYQANARTFKMGIDQRFADHFAQRFKGFTVLETCCGAGFCTIALARYAKQVFSVDINNHHLEMAVQNLNTAGLAHKVTFLHDDVLDPGLTKSISGINAAFLDPDWADGEQGHVYRFINSNTEPPADVLLTRITEITTNIALVLPPKISKDEFRHLQKHECEKLYFAGNHELYCLYFGALKQNQSSRINIRL